MIAEEDLMMHGTDLTSAIEGIVGNMEIRMVIVCFLCRRNQVSRAVLIAILLR